MHCAIFTPAIWFYYGLYMGGVPDLHKCRIALVSVIFVTTMSNSDTRGSNELQVFRIQRVYVRSWWDRALAHCLDLGSDRPQRLARFVYPRQILSLQHLCKLVHTKKSSQFQNFSRFSPKIRTLFSQSSIALLPSSKSFVI